MSQKTLFGLVDVQYYDHVRGELKHSQEYKAKKFLAHDCIQYDYDNKVFQCLPIEGYNTRTYTLERIEGRYQCNCQGYAKAKKDTGMGFCSHVWALLLHLSGEHGK